MEQVAWERQRDKDWLEMDRLRHEIALKNLRQIAAMRNPSAMSSTWVLLLLFAVSTMIGLILGLSF
ncbi:hypothetical protein [uncultured Paracoccus sp.]|uniref:hypothetical protein n=1 Tax=uncultured Paracoccus sp. TaxID=189685 RepID=UPI002627D268|nr:hypothetical protein [uncultured Paracoccus sp.]